MTIKDHLLPAPRRLAQTLGLAWGLCLAGTGAAGAQADPSQTWRPVPGKLQTRWAAALNPTQVLPEYPRPQMVRAAWTNLNGLWDHTILNASVSLPQPGRFEGPILVPFPLESSLSGVARRLGEDERLWYRRSFQLPIAWAGQGQRILLHFGGVDWETTVFVNRREIGSHRGGYDAFSFDITEALRPNGAQELLVAVRDPGDAGPQPRGKQVRKPGGIWYTPVSGIWQSVWLEPVGQVSVERLELTPDIDQETLTLSAELRGAAEGITLEAVALEEGREISQAQATNASTLVLSLPDCRLWSPDSPHLYDLVVSLKKNGVVLDEIKSYFGMRSINMARDADGFLRLQLNGKTLFQYGLLDQGWWPDGLYTAPSDEALRYDIEMTRRLGFNMIRKHVKVEPARWYYWCDRLGLLVWQDMPSGDQAARWKGPSGVDGVEMQRTSFSAALYETELKALIKGLFNHPSIVVWVPFNEGWGQFDTERILNLTKTLDPTRLVDGPSGGNHFPGGDLLDHHQYPGPGAPKRVPDRALVLGEFGGLGLPLAGHTWQDNANWGYRTYRDAASLTQHYRKLIDNLRTMIRTHGLAAAIYTQTTDVEIEVNGMLTYDRAVVKMNPLEVLSINLQLYQPWPDPEPADDL